MTCLLTTLSEFIDGDRQNIDSLTSIDYWYEGYCPQTQQWLRLPRTALSKAIAFNLMDQLSQDTRYSNEGKMYGILLVKTPSNEQKVLKAFSGLLNGESVVPGWVPPIPGRHKISLQETETLIQLEEIKQQIINLDVTSEKQEYEQLSQQWSMRLQALATIHQQRKQQRQKQRQLWQKQLQDNDNILAIALEQLNEESRRDKREKKQLKQQRDQVLNPLQKKISTAEKTIHQLKQQRKQLSRQLQTQMHAVYSLTNFAGTTQSLQDLIPNGLPTGTGDCCAPKLLHYAATHKVTPLAMAEFWWGPASGDKKTGEFYGACQERCQPLMGFLLSGLSAIEHRVSHQDFEIIYEDNWLVAVNKPRGLLSVPGRYHHNQDSVLSRLRHLLPNGDHLISIHRLDQDTSGILLLAKDQETYQQLTRQFRQRQVKKIYEAILLGSLLINQGSIQLPLWGDPNHRPYQTVDFEQGKPSLTHFQVISREVQTTRINLIPVTGRTHQLRVHCADSLGLGMPILGDRLYSKQETNIGLHLHAKEIHFFHPHLSQTIQLQVPTPF